MTDTTVYRSSISGVLLSDVVVISLCIIYLPLVSLLFHLGNELQGGIIIAMIATYYMYLAYTNHDIILSTEQIQINNRLSFNFSQQQIPLNNIKQVVFVTKSDEDVTSKKKHILIKGENKNIKVRCYGLKIEDYAKSESNFKRLYLDLKARNLPVVWVNPKNNIDKYL